MVNAEGLVGHKQFITLVLMNRSRSPGVFNIPVLRHSSYLVTVAYGIRLSEYGSGAPNGFISSLRKSKNGC